MISFAAFLVLAWCVPNILARNETLEHAWVREPSGRGTWSILWSCLATIFICTWTVLHLNVPKPGHGRAYLQFRKIAWMLIALIAPEIVLFTSAEHLSDSRAMTRAWREKGDRGWTLTHAQFARAKGFYTSTSEGQIAVCHPNELTEHIIAGRIGGPPISENELKSRGASDSLIKLVAILQIICFALQTLFRAIGHDDITAIEIMTVAFVVCSIFTYGFFWHQPQNVEYPVILHIRDVAAVADDENGLEENPGLSTMEEERSELSPALHQPRRMRSRFYDLIGEDVPDALLCTFAVGFGAMHCLAWNSPFPSPKERLLWRICSVASTALPVPIIIALKYTTNSSWFTLVCSVFGPPLYISARIFIIYLAFMSLRVLPASAYQTVTWTNYIPHFL